MLLGLVVAGAGFHGDPFSILSTGPERLWEIADRRGPVVGISVLAWLAAFGLALALDRERSGRPAARLFALTLVYMPLVLLGAAALEPGQGAERLLLALGAPALAALTLAALGGYRALAFACAATVLAHTVDLICGSPLTQLSLAGPNPAAGHRFYGIGNELEAILIVLVLAGTGAALTALTTAEVGQSRLRREGEGRRDAIVFVAIAAFFSFAFAYGRFGADVGAAIALPFGAVVAAALCLGRPRLAWLALAVPLPALAVLALADLLSGADAHLTKTVLQADGGDDVLGVIGRRLGEAGESFGRPLLLAGLPLTIAGAIAAWLRRDRIAAWMVDLPALRAGMLAALAAIVLATVANDSGALLLELGAAYLGAFLAFIWAESGRPSSARDIDYA